MASGTTTATLSFGAAPGTNTATVTVTGQAGITTAAYVEAFWQGNDSTASHNAYEHKHIFPGRVALSADALVNNTGFDITATTELRLTGTVVCRVAWNG